VCVSGLQVRPEGLGECFQILLVLTREQCLPRKQTVLDGILAMRALPFGLFGPYSGAHSADRILFPAHSSFSLFLSLLLLHFIRVLQFDGRREPNLVLLVMCPSQRDVTMRE
jgi:hypothetical protein